MFTFYFFSNVANIFNFWKKIQGSLRVYSGVIAHGNRSLLSIDCFSKRGNTQTIKVTYLLHQISGKKVNERSVQL